MLNVVAIMGRLTADPELKTTNNGVSVCSFRIAVDRSYTPKGQDRQADFFVVTAWRNTAEFVAKYFAKGSLIAVNGQLQSRSYEKDGERRTAVEIVAAEVNFAGAKQKAEESGEYSANVQPSETDYTQIDGEEDLPF